MTLSQANGFDEAYFENVNNYLHGEGVPKDPLAAAALINLAASMGHKASQLFIGMCYKSGTGVIQSSENALFWFKKAQTSDDPKTRGKAMSEIATFYHFGVCVPLDIAQAIQWYEKAVECGDTDAAYNLGTIYLEEEMTEKYERAFELFSMAAEKGNVSALGNLGYMYSDGKGVPQDYQKAVELFKMAANKNDPASIYAMGFLYENGLEVKQNYLLAQFYYGSVPGEIRDDDIIERLSALSEVFSSPYYQELVDDETEYIYRIYSEQDKDDEVNLTSMMVVFLASKDYPPALYDMAMILIDEPETDDDDTLNFFYYISKAAKLGYAPAQYEYGKYLIETADDDAERAVGVKYLKTAARRNHAKSANYLALYYDERMNFDSSIKYHKLASELGDAGSQFYLAKMYAETKQCFILAEKSANQGYIPATELLADLYRDGLCPPDFDGVPNERMYLVSLKKSAEAGSVVSQYNLGLLCEDEGEAYRLFYTASKGYPQAAEMMSSYDFHTDFAKLRADSKFSIELKSDEVKAFEQNNPVTELQRWQLAFGSVLTTMNFESSKVFNFNRFGTKAEKYLLDAWDIKDSDSADFVLESLANGTGCGRTKMADEVLFLIKKGIFFVTFEDVYNFIEKMQLIEYAESVLKSFSAFDFICVYPCVTNKLIFDITRIAAYNSQKRQREVNLSEIDRIYQDIEDKHFSIMDGIYKTTASRINDAVKAYQDTCTMLNRLGYSDDEIAAVPSTAAWDYGRTAFIARACVSSSYISEEDARKYIKTAAENAASTYSDWRQFLAASVLCRALAYRNVSKDYEDILCFLLYDEESPLNEVEFGGMK